MRNTENFLDWLVELDIQHYKTTPTSDYKPSGKSHFYLKGSPERFTSFEMIKIFEGTASKNLNNRWNGAIADVAHKNRYKS